MRAKIPASSWRRRRQIDWW